MASSVFVSPGFGSFDGTNFVPTYPLAFPNGTSSLPSITFASETSLGLYRASAGVLGATGSFTVIGGIQAAAGNGIYWAGRAIMTSPADGEWVIQNQAQTIGSQVKADALPTIASGGGGSPAVTAGSTAFAGSLTVGSAPGSTNIVVNFNGTAFPSAPFIVWNNTTTSTAPKATTSTTQITFTSAAWAASDVLSWICISSK